MCCVAESQRPASRGAGFRAAGGRPGLRGRAPAASGQQRKACRRPEETRGAAALHRRSGSTSSGLPTSTETQKKLFLSRLMQRNGLELGKALKD